MTGHRLRAGKSVCVRANAPRMTVSAPSLSAVKFTSAREAGLEVVVERGRSTRRNSRGALPRSATRRLPGTDQPSTCDRIQSKLACMLCCHSDSRRATIRASLSGWAAIPKLSPDGPGPIRAQCRISAPLLLVSTSNPQLALIPSGPTTLYTHRRSSSTSTISHTVSHAPRASCWLRPRKRAPTRTPSAPSSHSTNCNSVEHRAGRVMSVT